MPVQLEVGNMAIVKDDQIRNVLFLCRINAGRSIMAEAITNARSGGTIRAFSAGAEPLDRVPPSVLSVLQAHGVPTDGLKTKTWHQFAGFNAPRLDFVISTCDAVADNVCPSWPGQPLSARWSIPEPARAGASPEDIRANLEDSFELICRLVDMFICLPVATRDRMALKAQLDRIA